MSVLFQSLDIPKSSANEGIKHFIETALQTVATGPVNLMIVNIISALSEIIWLLCTCDCAHGDLRKNEKNRVTTVPY